MSELVAIGLGANLGDLDHALRDAVQAIAGLPQTTLVSVSSLFRSAPIDAGGPDYLNAVALVRTQMQPLPFLQALQAIEQAAGRQRSYRNAPRTLDLDIELWGEQVIDLPDLSVPHSRMWQRAFVLLPLAELLPERISPAQLAAVADQRIERMASPQQSWWA